jgi:ATP-dependent Clp protease ATP-binding subunit ClpA
MLLALLEERDPLIEARLLSFGIQPAEAQAQLRRLLGTGDDRLWDGILVTPRLRTVVELAGRIAEKDEVEPSHLLAAIVEEGKGCAAELLARLGQGVTAWNT